MKMEIIDGSHFLVNVAVRRDLLEKMSAPIRQSRLFDGTCWPHQVFRNNPSFRLVSLIVAVACNARKLTSRPSS